MFDQYDDSGRHQLYKFNNLFEMPDFVKEASESDKTDLDGIPSSSFADPARRKYPTHTRHDAWLSRLYFSKNKSMYKNAGEAGLVQSRLERASVFWGLPDKYDTKPGLDKKASPSVSIPIENYSGDKIDEWRLYSPRDFEKAAIQIFENKNMFIYPQRKKAARILLANRDLFKDAKLADEVEAYLEKAAGYGLCEKEEALNELKGRALLYERMDPRFSEKVAAMAEEIASNEESPALLSKAAEIIDLCDRSLGLFQRYRDGRLRTPEEALFTMTEKTAREEAGKLVRLANGRVLPIEKLGEQALDGYFDNIVGDNPGGTYEDKLAVVKALPVPDADDLVKYVERD